MRITNNMITNNTKTNINNNKILVDKYNNQMTTQKKISKASEDPVVAIRSLRLQTNLNHIDQYVDNNIPDAESWLETTSTALGNMKDILTDIRTQCVNGSTDTLTADDRKTLQQQLGALVDQVYTEGNADYAGRTVFTGYRTSSMLTFQEDTSDTVYEITQDFDFNDINEHRYYFGATEVPTVVDSTTTDCQTDVSEETLYRYRLAYEGVDGTNLSLSATDSTGATSALTVEVYATQEDWEAASAAGTTFTSDAVLIEESGEIIFSPDMADTLKDGEATLSITYEKTGFDKGEVRPEYYYDCKDLSLCTRDAAGTWTDLTKQVSYTKENQEINYTIANSTLLTVNTQASDVFTTDIQRDVEELISCVEYAISAHDKVDKITAMMTETQYADDESQAKLQTYLDAAQKEADYADDNLQKTYGSYITNFDNYLTNVNTAITNVGSMQDRLSLTKTRVENQQTTISELKTNNEDRDLSDIIIDYYASYNAYTASLTAAGKLGDQTLLNYI